MAGRKEWEIEDKRGEAESSRTARPEAGAGLGTGALGPFIAPLALHPSPHPPSSPDPISITPPPHLPPVLEYFGPGDLRALRREFPRESVIGGLHPGVVSGWRHRRYGLRRVSKDCCKIKKKI
jgi:hypothetical protein